MTIAMHEGLSAIADRYDGFILDMWGVLHNGVSLLPGAVDCLTRMRAAGKSSVILSNAPRRADKVLGRAIGFGMPDGLVDAVHSSGEESWNRLRRRGADSADPFFRDLGPAVYYMGAMRDFDLAQDLDLTLAERPEDADFILNVGPAPLSETLGDYLKPLEAGARAGLPMICANPDLIVMVGDRPADCAGKLAKHYEDLGGTVRWLGKPYPEVYETAMGLLDGVAADRMLAVGDSLRTDVAGALGVGIDCGFVPGGIHLADLGTPEGELPDAERLAAMSDSAGAAPTMALPGLVW